MEDRNTLPEMPDADGGDRGQMLESMASMLWTISFLAYSSSTFLSEFGTGSSALWTVILVAFPSVLASMHPVLDGERGAARGKCSLFEVSDMPLLCMYARVAHALTRTCAALMHLPEATGKYIIYVLAPAICVLYFPGSQNIRDVVSFLALWLPLELKLLPKIGPTGRVSIWAQLTASMSAVNTFTVLRPLTDGRGMGYTFKLGPSDLFIGLVFIIATGPLSVAVGKAIGYGRIVKPRGLKPAPQAAIFLGLYYAGLGEELLFRGIGQNLLERWLGRNAVLPLFLGALMYGSAHFKSTAQGLPTPNWRAALLATLAGLSYGLVWRLSEGKSTVSALTQAGVAFSLRTFFTKPAVS